MKFKKGTLCFDDISSENCSRDTLVNTQGIEILGSHRQNQGRGKEIREENYRKPAELTRVMVLTSRGSKGSLKKSRVLNCFFIHSSGWYLVIRKASRIDKWSSLLEDSRIENTVGLYAAALAGLFIK